jgi:hypothetical protein
MAKKIKYGKVELPADEFADENISTRISMMVPQDLLMSLRKLSLNEKYFGKYQVLIKDVLKDYVAKHQGKKSKAG